MVFSYSLMKVGSLVKQEAEYFVRLRNDVESLKNDCDRIKYFLSDVSLKDIKHKGTQKWVNDIREVCLDADDIVDSYSLLTTGFSLKRGVKLIQQIFQLEFLGNKIRKLRRRLEIIESSRLKYDVCLGDDITWERRVEKDTELGRRTNLLQDQCVVGLDKEIRSLSENFILNEAKALSIISIVGMGGIGKSTLARQLYQEVAPHFECNAWAVVSNIFSPKDTIKEVIQQVGGLSEVMDKFALPALIEILCERLRGKRYLVVLDDVWETAAWESLANTFPDEGLSSRIIVTSRNQNVVTGTKTYTHTMEVLDDAQSWELLLKMTDIKDIEGLKDVGSKILQRCNGLPLAINVVAPLLMEPTFWKWNKVFNTLNSHLGTGDSKLEAIIDLSYEYLPAPVRVCFLCASFFPKNTEIRANKLVQYWAALGLLPEESEGETKVDTGYRYLDDLLNQSMFHSKSVSGYDRVTGVMLHDVLYNYSVMKAKEERGLWMLNHEVSSKKMDKARHVVVDVEMVGSKDLKKQANYVRLLSFHGSSSQHLIFEKNKFYWKEFHLLKILDFEDLHLSLTDAIGELQALKFLGLRRSMINKVPDGVGRLQNLEVLDLKTRMPFVLNDSALNLEALRHLYMSYPMPQCSIPVDRMKYIQTLTGLEATRNSLAKLMGLKNIQKLGLSWSKKVGLSWSTRDETLFEFHLHVTLAEMERLYSLRLDGTVPKLDALVCLRYVVKLKLGGIVVLPAAKHFPPQLRSLVLSGIKLNEEPTRKLQELSITELKILDLEFFDSSGSSSSFTMSISGFRKLKSMYLWKLAVREIEIKEGGLPILERLEIRRCDNLKGVPTELEPVTIISG